MASADFSKFLITCTFLSKAFLKLSLKTPDLHDLSYTLSTKQGN